MTLCLYIILQGLLYTTFADSTSNLPDVAAYVDRQFLYALPGKSADTKVICCHESNHCSSRHSKSNNLTMWLFEAFLQWLTRSECVLDESYITSLYSSLFTDFYNIFDYKISLWEKGGNFVKFHLLIKF